jgi:hypothetical protein
MRDSNTLLLIWFLTKERKSESRQAFTLEFCTAIQKKKVTGKVKRK